MGLFFNRQKEVRDDSSTMTVTNSFPSDLALQALLQSNSVVSGDRAMEIPAVASCVNFICGTISMLPIKLYKQEDDGNGKKIITELETDPRCTLLNLDPRDTLNAREMKAAWVKDYLLYGSSYIYINKSRNNFRSLNYVAYQDISVSKNDDPIFKSYELNVNGGVYYPHQFLKILRGSKDGSTGIGVPAENGKILGVAYDTLIFQGLLVSKGGNKKGFLKSQKKLTQEAIDALKAAWKKLYSNNEETVVILNDGLDFQESSSTSTELQLNENKTTDNAEICSIFNICPNVLNGTASDEQYNLTIKMAILPILAEITTTLNRDLLLEKEKGSYFFAFDTSEVMRGDLEKRYSAYSSAVKAGWITKNEIRAKENMVAIDGLDIVGMSLGDVLYDVENKTFFTPNTGTVADMDGNILDEGIAGKSEEPPSDEAPAEDEDKNLEEGGVEGDEDRDQS